MDKQMDEAGFGTCSDTRACEVECPKEIAIENIAAMNSMYVAAVIG